MWVKRIFFSRWFIGLIIILALLGSAINGLLGNGSDEVIVKVGSTKVGVDAFLQEYRTKTDELQRMFNYSLTQEQIREMWLGEVVLAKLIEEASLSHFFNKIKFYIDDSIVTGLIKKDADFLSDGVFDRAKWYSFLRNSGMTERRYINKVKQDVAKNLFFMPFLRVEGDYKDIAERLYKVDYEKRKVHLVSVPKKGDIVFSLPEESDLSDYFNKHSDDFYVGEYRKIEYTVLSLNSIKPGLLDIKKSEFNKRLKTYDLDRKYYIKYIEFISRDEAERMKNSITSNEEFYDNDLVHIEGKFAFELPEFLPKNLQWDGNKWIIQKYAGRFYLYKVAKTVPASNKDKNKIGEEVRQIMKFEKLSAITAEVVEAVSLGVPATEIDKKYGVTTQTTDFFDENLKSEDGRSTNLGMALGRFAFANNIGTTGAIINDEGDALVVVRLLDINSPRKRSFDEVRDQIMDILSDRNKKVAISKYLTLSLESDFPGKVVADFVRPSFVSAEQKKMQDRYPVELVEAIFLLQEVGDKTEVFYKDGTAFMAMLSNKITPQIDDSVVVEIESMVRKMLGYALLHEFTNSISKDFKVEVNRRLITDFLVAE